MQINTATGPVDVDRLGKTLMHEHLVIGFPGWDSDTSAPSQSVREMTAVCLDRIGELNDRIVAFIKAQAVDKQAAQRHNRRRR